MDKFLKILLYIAYFIWIIFIIFALPLFRICIFQPLQVSEMDIGDNLNTVNTNQFRPLGYIFYGISVTICYSLLIFSCYIIRICYNKLNKVFKIIFKGNIIINILFVILIFFNMFSYTLGIIATIIYVLFLIINFKNINRYINILSSMSFCLILFFTIEVLTFFMFIIFPP